MKICSPIPTNNFEHIMKSIDTIHYIKDLNIKFLIAFQKPITKEQVKICTDRLDGIGIKYDYIHIDAFESSDFSSVLLRKNALNIDRDCDIYLTMDDNFIYSGSVNTTGGEYSVIDAYRKCIEYMEKNKDCGVICCRGGYKEKIKHNGILPCIDGVTSIGKGMFTRNIPEYTSVPNIKSGGEDFIFAYNVLSKGYYFARAYNVPVIHDDLEMIGDNGKNTKWNFNDAFEYIKEEYRDESWYFHKGAMPVGFHNCFESLSDHSKYEFGDFILK